MTLQQRLSRLTILEWIVVAIIVGILVALLVPQTQWVSDGSIRLPVRVFVFDAVRKVPIKDAQVMVLRSPPVSDPESLKDARDRFTPDHLDELPEEYWKLTSSEGFISVDHEFGTSASHTRPVSHTHLGNVWVRVEAKGFGGAVIPVRHESQPTSTLRKQGEILVQIGLYSDK